MIPPQQQQQKQNRSKQKQKQRSSHRPAASGQNSEPQPCCIIGRYLARSVNSPLCAERSSRAKRTWDSRLAGGGGDGVDALRFQRSFVLHTTSSSRGCAALQEQQLILGLEVGVVACLPQVQRRRAVVEGRRGDGEATVDCLLRLGGFDNLRSNRSSRSNPVRERDKSSREAAKQAGRQPGRKPTRQAARKPGSQLHHLLLLLSHCGSAPS